MSNRIELEGRVIAQPELRVTPAGTSLLRLRVDCGERPRELVIAVVMAGGEARALTGQLRVGSVISLTGTLRVQSGGSPGSAGGSALEVAAHEIHLVQSG